MKKIFAGAIAALLLAGAASAQPIGTVSEIDGEVWVVRGEKTYTLSKGDAIFEGDRVITQKGGTATIDAYSCPKPLPEQASIVADSGFCAKDPVRLGSGQETTFSSGGTVGTAAFALPVVVAAVAAAAASDDDEPSSP
jgi:hypothetical protein